MHKDENRIKSEAMREVYRAYLAALSSPNFDREAALEETELALVMLDISDEIAGYRE